METRHLVDDLVLLLLPARQRRVLSVAGQLLERAHGLERLDLLLEALLDAHGVKVAVVVAVRLALAQLLVDLALRGRHVVTLEDAAPLASAAVALAHTCALVGLRWLDTVLADDLDHVGVTGHGLLLDLGVGVSLLFGRLVGRDIHQVLRACKVADVEVGVVDHGDVGEVLLRGGLCLRPRPHLLVLPDTGAAPGLIHLLLLISRCGWVEEVAGHIAPGALRSHRLPQVSAVLLTPQSLTLHLIVGCLALPHIRFLQHSSGRGGRPSPATGLRAGEGTSAGQIRRRHWLRLLLTAVLLHSL